MISKRHTPRHNIIKIAKTKEDKEKNKDFHANEPHKVIS